MIRFLLLGALIFYSCGPALKLIDATSQSWAGGIPQSGKGTNFRFKFVVNKSSDKLVIDKVWIGKKFFPDIKVFSLNTRKPEFKKKDTIIVFVRQHFKPVPDIPPLKKRKIRKTPKIKKNVPPPFKYNGKALISYLVKGKRKYLTIEKIKRLKPINYP